jgi:hypothetical protein
MFLLKYGLFSENRSVYAIFYSFFLLFFIKLLQVQKKAVSLHRI